MRTLIFQNSSEIIVRISALKVYITSLGLPGSFLGLHVGFLLYDQSICTHSSSLSGRPDIFLGSGPFFTGSQTDPCFQNKNSGGRLTGRLCPPGSYKKFQGRNPYDIFVAILENRCLHKFILSLTDL